MARLALMSADRETEDAPTPRDRLQLVSEAQTEEQQQKERKREEMCQKQGKEVQAEGEVRNSFQ